MRARLLAAGASSLADYEILEMLLFLGIPRRDTKPLAKAMINRYGSLAGTLRTTPETLMADWDLGRPCTDVLALAAVAETKLARAEQRQMPTLGDWAQLVAYLATSAAQVEPGQWRMLYLDNRNRLLADEAVARSPGARASDPKASGAKASDPCVAADANEGPTRIARSVMARALALHATALIALRIESQSAAGPLRVAAALAKELGRASGLLSLVLHDTLVGSGSEWVSLRQRGLL